MARRRYISTVISVDVIVNRLACKSDFAALLYTWMIPHAEEDGTITADPEELLYTVCPARRDKDVEDVQDAVALMREMGLLILHEELLYFPVESFYRYQSNVHADRRREGDPEPSALIGAHNAASSSSSSSSSSPSKDMSSVDDDHPPDSKEQHRIFDHWRDVMGKNGRTKLDNKRRRAIKWATKTYSEDECLAAIDGCSQSDWHMGRDPKVGGKKYNDITLIFRDAQHAEEFMGLASGRSDGRTWTPDERETIGAAVKLLDERKDAEAQDMCTTDMWREVVRLASVQSRNGD